MDGIFLLEITCRWCGQSFYICQSCWRGHAYCSVLCKYHGYQRCKKRRQDKYRDSYKGQKTRKIAERKRSLRQSAKKSGDAGSNPVPTVIIFPVMQSLHEPCCHFCGQKGVIFNQFVQRKHGGRFYTASNNQISPQGGYYDPKNTTHQPANQKN